jgi:isocitrate lyase
MAIDVHGYGRVRKCICKLTHAYVCITKMEMHRETEDKDMSKVMSTSIVTVAYVSIKVVEEEGSTQIDGCKYRKHTQEYSENLNEYDRGGKCSYMLGNKYAVSGGMKLQMEKVSRHMSRVMRA